MPAGCPPLGACVWGFRYFSPLPLPSCFLLPSRAQLAAILLFDRASFGLEQAEVDLLEAEGKDPEVRSRVLRRWFSALMALEPGQVEKLVSQLLEAVRGLPQEVHSVFVSLPLSL